MLVTLRTRRTALVLPLWIGAAALVCAGLSVPGVLRGVEWKASTVITLWGLLLAWLTVMQLRVISVEQGLLRVWRAGKQQQLSAPAVAFGVRRSGTRAIEYVVFASDGAQRCDLSTHVSSRWARRSAERIGKALLEPGHVPSVAAAQAVLAQEQDWQASAQQAQRMVDEYYSSPTWKWSKRVMVALLSAYVVGMGLYQWLSGAR